MRKSQKTLASALALGAFIALAAPVGRADPEVQAPPGCADASADQAKSRADELYRQGLFQRAGECYEAAGDLPDANEAFAKAARPNGKTAARELEQQGQVAKTLFTSVQQAFRSGH